MTVSTADAELVARARMGDAEAIAELVRAHQAVMHRTAYLVCGDAAEAEDAVQEAFVKAFRALGRFREDRPLRPWLLAIAGNEARNRRRSAGRREGLVLRAAVQPDAAGGPAVPGSAADDTGGPEALALASERRAALLAAIERLPEEHRLVVGCRYLLELDEAETAAALGVRRGTVKSRLSRALDKLRRDLGDDVDAA